MPGQDENTVIDNPRQNLRTALQALGFERVSYTDKDAAGNYEETWRGRKDAVVLKWGGAKKV